MLKGKLMKMANELKLGKGKDFIKNRKKEICAGGLGVLLLAGIGFGVSSLVNADTSSATVTVGDRADGVANTYEETENEEEVSTSPDGEEVVSNKKLGKTEDAKVAKDGETVSATKGGTSSTEVTKDGETVSTTKESTSSTEKSSDVVSATVAEQPTSESTPKKSFFKSGGTKQTSTPAVTPSKETPKPVVTPVKETPSHSHSWSPVTSVVNHEASGHWEDVVVKAAWSEEIPKYENKERAVCNACNADITETNVPAHVEKHMLAGERGSYRSAWKKIQVGTKTVNHSAVYDKKWVVDKQAWSETVTNGHKCSCGSTK